MHNHSENCLSTTRGRWLKAVSICIGCFGLWSNLGHMGSAQTNHPPLAKPITAGNVDQIFIPPPEDVPEEILRTEIIFDARSPLDGSPLSPAEYAQLQTDLAAAQTTPTLNHQIRYIIFLLEARRAFKPVIPFLP